MCVCVCVTCPSRGKVLYLNDNDVFGKDILWGGLIWRLLVYRCELLDAFNTDLCCEVKTRSHAQMRGIRQIGKSKEKISSSVYYFLVVSKQHH